MQEVVVVEVAAPMDLIDLLDVESEDRKHFGLFIQAEREALSLAPSQLAIAAGISVSELNLLEMGVSFDTMQEAGISALMAIERQQDLRAGKAHLRLV